MKIILEQPAVGTIFSNPNDNSPDVDHYFFILDENITKLRAKQGMFTYTFSEEGMLVGKIERILVRNEYFANPQTVKHFDQGDQFGINNYFPSDKWEDFIAEVKVLSVFQYLDKRNNKDNNFTTFEDEEFEISHMQKRPAFPSKPGNKVFILDGERLMNFLGITENGLNLGQLEHYNIDFNVNLNRLLNKHLGILAMSGAGKSYLVSVLLEELLNRSAEMGTPGIVLIDVHGEYKFLSDQSIPENRNIAMKTSYYDGKYFQIGCNTLQAYDFSNYQPNMSRPQIRELKKAIDRLKKGIPENEIEIVENILKDNIDAPIDDKVEILDNNNDSVKNINEETEKNNKKNRNYIYDLKNIISIIETSEGINPKVQDTLVSWLYDLMRLNLFGSTTNPPLNNLVKPGRLAIIDLSNLISLRKKQIIVSYLCDHLFYMRRNGIIPPFLMVIEEAHQFAPEGTIGDAGISKKIIETIAREGRKFFALLCLISQRPVKLSTTALSQCNTHIILRITNPNDLDHIKNSSEALTRGNLKMISTLPTGNALLMGTATNLPIFFKVRERETSNPYGEEELDEICTQYQ